MRRKIILTTACVLLTAVLVLAQQVVVRNATGTNTAQVSENALHVILDSGTVTGAATEATLAGIATTLAGVSTEVTLDRVADAVEDTAPVMTLPVGGVIISGVVSSAMTSTTSTEVIAGVASNYFNIGWCIVSNASLTVSTDILLQTGSGGTTIAVLPAPAASVATTGGGGSMIVLPTPLPVRTAGSGLFAANVTTGSSTKITCGGWRSTTAYF